MREFSAPPAVTVPDDARLTDVVFDHAASDPDLVSFSRRRGGRWVDVNRVLVRPRVSGLEITHSKLIGSTSFASSAKRTSRSGSITS